MIFKFNSAKAVQYANTYISKSNYFFKKFLDKEEEVSFVSQCILSGSNNQMCKGNQEWFYDDEKNFSKSWIDGDELCNFLLKSDCGPFGRLTSEGGLSVGDLVFYGFDNDQKHVGIVTKFSNDMFFILVKTKNPKEICLNEIKDYNKKFVHILGVKK